MGFTKDEMVAKLQGFFKTPPKYTLPTEETGWAFEPVLYSRTFYVYIIVRKDDMIWRYCTVKDSPQNTDIMMSFQLTQISAVENLLVSETGISIKLIRDGNTIAVLPYDAV